MTVRNLCLIRNILIVKNTCSKELLRLLSFLTKALFVQRVPLSFQHAYDADRAAKNTKDLERSLMEICESTKSGVRPETPRLFASLVYIMKTMEAAEMAVLYQKVNNGAVCSENQVHVK